VTLRLSGNVRAAFSASLALFFISYPAGAATDPSTSKLLKNVENRYNHAQTLQVGFSETLVNQGRHRTESGELFLRKPGRMRWQYSNPASKLFVSDGKSVYFYSSDTNRAEKMKLKETEDMRAPMAFLLGKLEFEKDFKDFRFAPEGGSTRITAVPKSDKLPYREVAFLVGQDARIERLIVTGQDASILDFTFTDEKRNPKLADSLFKFQLPPGAELVDSSQEVH
jgi:outer membrane lipoprotein carrier protein